MSIIIPAYNAEKYLSETIQSVLQQDYDRWELILVNDGSVDRTPEICEEWQARDSRIKVVHQENTGVSSARNRGYLESSGDFICFLDSDDVWKADNLDAKLELIRQGSYGLVHSDAQLINADSKPEGGLMQGKSGHLLEDYLLWNGSCVPGPSSILIRREVLESVGLFDPELSTSADQDIFIRISSRYEIGRVPRVTWFYRVHSENMHKNVEAMERDVVRVFQKADENGIMSKNLRRRAWGITYRVLGASWMGDGNNFWRGLLFILKSAWIYPRGIPGLISRSVKNS